MAGTRRRGVRMFTRLNQINLRIFISISFRAGTLTWPTPSKFILTQGRSPGFYPYLGRRTRP
jgi:hypothetical protein